MTHTRTARTAEEWFTVMSMGTYEDDYKNGTIWTFNGEVWYLSHLELNEGELAIVNFMADQF